MKNEWTADQKKILKAKESVTKLFVFEADRHAFQHWKDQIKPFWDEEKIRDLCTYASMNTNPYTGKTNWQMDVKWYALQDKMNEFLETANSTADRIVNYTDYEIPEAINKDFEKTRKEALELYKQAAEIEFLALEPESLICFDYTGNFECPEGMEFSWWNNNLYKNREIFIDNLKKIPEGLHRYKTELYKDVRQKIGLEKLNKIYSEWAKLENFKDDINAIRDKYTQAIKTLTDLG